MKIGIFDSGIGGLSVLHEAYHMLPSENYIFYADTAHVPYGLKTPAEIESYADEITRFLINKGVDVIIVACNTATSVAIKELRHHYNLPIVGMEPAVKPAVSFVAGQDKGTTDRVLVMATPVTISEEKLRNLLIKVDDGHIVDLLPMPKLVSFAESEMMDSPEVKAYLSEQFSSIDINRYAAVVLGCTHFNYFKPLYGEFFGEGTRFFDGNHGTIAHVADVLGLKVCGDSDRTIHFNDIEEMHLCGNTVYYASGKEVTDRPMLEHFMRLHNRLEEVEK